MSKLPELGLHEGVPFDIYQSWEAVSNSRLSLFNISPAHYQVGYKPSTKSMDVGSVVHSVVLEDQKFAVVPPFNLDVPDEDGKGGNKDAKGKPSTSKNTTYYKHKVEIFAAAHEHEQIVSQDTYDMAMGVRASVPAIFENGEPECSLLWRDADSGLVCKGRVDYLCERRFIDLKTTASAMSFESSIQKFGYHRQMAFYMEGLKACTGKHFEPWICAVETEAPFGCRCAPVGLDALVAGYNELRTLLEALSECVFTDTWPCYEDPVEWNLPT